MSTSRPSPSPVASSSSTTSTPRTDSSSSFSALCSPPATGAQTRDASYGWGADSVPSASGQVAGRAMHREEAYGLGVGEVENVVWAHARGGNAGGGGGGRVDFPPSFPPSAFSPPPTSGKKPTPLSPPLVSTITFSSSPSQNATAQKAPLQAGGLSSSPSRTCRTAPSRLHLSPSARDTAFVPPSSPTSQRLFPFASPPAFVRRAAAALLPHNLVPAFLSAPPSPPTIFQYPKSPSLLRDPPTKRHGRRRACVPSSPRRGAILALVLVLPVLLYAQRGPSLSHVRSGPARPSAGASAEKGQRGWRAGERQKEKAGLVDTAEELSRAEAMEARVDYGSLLEGLRGEPDRPLADLPPPSPPTAPAAVDDAAPAPDSEEAAALDSVVAQAAAEALQHEEDVKNQLAMARVVKARPGSQAETAQALVAKEAEKAAKALSDPAKKKDPGRYKRLLPLGGVSRRYLYGANFVAGSEAKGEKDKEVVEEVDDPERTNKKVKVPSRGKLKRLFREGREKYLEEAPGWREYEWTAPPPHESLERVVAKLSPDERYLRDWIQRLHTLPAAGGIGLGQSAALPFPPSSASGNQDNLALVHAAPAFSRGSMQKYAELLRQAELGHAGKCEGATWLSKYEGKHREMLAGEREPKFISYSCEQGINCGGLGDRLLGMTSAFFFGLLTNRAFLAEWQSPIPLDVVFDSPHLNWSYSSFTSSSHPVLGQPALAEKAAELDIIHFDRLSVDATFGTASWNAQKDKPLTPGFEKRDLAYASPWIKFFTNRGMVYRSFQYKHLQKSIARLGLKPESAFACISQYLFKPKPPAMSLISQYTSVLALPSVFSIGIHVRTGDRSMRDPEWDQLNTVKRHTQFFRCARELGETYATKDQEVVFYLVTDSAYLKEDAQRVYGSKLVTTDIVPQHVHQKAGHAEGVFSAVVEDWILAKTDMLVATQDSGFGKLAAFMHAKEQSTVTIFPRYNPDVMGLQSKKSHLKVDCTSPDVFTTFEELSSEWSLG